VGGVVVFVTLGVLADAYLQALGMARRLQALYPDLRAARTELTTGAFGPKSRGGAAIREASDLQLDVERARFTFGLTGWLPFLGRPVQVVRHGVGSAYEATRAFSIIQEVASETLGSAPGSGQEGSDGSSLIHKGVVDLELLQGLAPRVESAIGHLESAQRELEAIPHIPFVDRVDRLKQTALRQSEETMALARRALEGLRILPEALGSEEPRTYFLALQNNADQRATGGTVLAYSLIHIREGRIELIGGGSVYEIDRRLNGIHVDLPAPVRWYLRAVGRPPRLAQGINYTPRFPVVASTWARQVEKRTGVGIDGVIALDPVGVSYLLRGQPPIRVPSYAEPISAKNVVFITENDQYRLPWPQQLTLPGELIEKAFRLLTDPDDTFAMIRNLSPALAGKHIQIWSAHPDQQSFVAEMDWDGALDHSSGDLLFVTRSKRNVGKQDYYAHQSIRYDVQLEPSGDASVTLRVGLDSRVPPGQPKAITGPWHRYGLNVAMFNVYVPRSATDVEAEAVQPERHRKLLQHFEARWRVYTQTIAAWKDHPASLTLRYRIPGVVRQGRDGNVYELTVPHQPMVPPARIRITVTLPSGVQLRAADGGWSVEGSRASFRGSLTRELRLKLVF
jgi:hypothetical protein